MLDLFPDTARIDEGGELQLGGIPVSALLRMHASPLVVYDEATVRAQIEAYRAAAPGALVVYGTKAFPNVALMRIIFEEGLGADVASLGELRYATEAGIGPDKIVVHGNNKSDEEIRTAAETGALLVLDSLEELDRARAAGARRLLLRITPGIDADTHEAIRTGHHGSKFGLRPDEAAEAIRHEPSIQGLHVHIGSGLFSLADGIAAVRWIASFVAQLRDETGWTPHTLDLGGGLGVATSPDETALPVTTFVGGILAELDRLCGEHDLDRPEIVLEPGRSLVGRAGVTLYTVGAVKRAADGTSFVAVDGGMSDNPRPALYGARYAALLANRAAEPPTGIFSVAGHHCESGDVLIDDVELPLPVRGDILAVPATGGYTLSMASNYNATPRPAAVLVSNGNARVIRRRETVDDMLALESS